MLQHEPKPHNRMNMNIDLGAVLVWLQSLGRPYPARDWFMILGLGLVVFACGAAMAGYLFLGVKTGALIDGGAAAPAAPVVSREKMQKVLERYGERFANFEAGNFGTFILKDPHLTLTPKK